MFGGLTRTSSRIAIAASLGLTLGTFALGTHPAKAADLGGDCCADLEERVAELEATTVRKGNKKVSVTISGWIVDLGTWWNDGHTSGLYWGSKDTTLSSHFNISGSATIAPGWSAGYTAWIEIPGNSAAVGFSENQFNDNAVTLQPGFNGTVNALDSYMWIKSDRWGTVNWGRLVQATNNLALLPDLSGTIIESNAVLFDGPGFFLRPAHGVHNSNDMASDFTWGAITRCISGGGGTGADCPTGLDGNGVRYDTPTWYGFSASGGEYENMEWDVAIKYAADWNSFKVSAAYGFAENTDEGCTSAGVLGVTSGCSGVANLGGGGAPFQGFSKDVTSNQVGASIMHVPSGLFIYGLWEDENNQGSEILTLNSSGHEIDSKANDNNAWWLKGGIKRTWSPLGATVIWGEGGQYQNMFAGLCGAGGVGTITPNSFGNVCTANINTGTIGNGVGNSLGGTAFANNVLIDKSTMNTWGLGVVQEIDSAAMHVFFRWLHFDANLTVTCNNFEFGCFSGNQNTENVAGGQKFSPKFNGLDMFQLGGVIFF